MPSLKELSPAKQIFVSRVFPWIVVLVGAATMYIGVENVYKAWKSTAWPTVEGEIIASSIETQYSTGTEVSSSTYHAKILYEYTVNGTIFTGHRVAYGEYGTGDPAHAERISDKYPKGMAVFVYYMPGKYRESVLEPGLKGVPWFFLVLGLVFLFAGILMVVFLPRLVAKVN